VGSIAVRNFTTRRERCDAVGSVLVTVGIMATRAPKGAARPRGGTTSRTRQTANSARRGSGSSARNRRGAGYS